MQTTNEQKALEEAADYLEMKVRSWWEGRVEMSERAELYCRLRERVGMAFVEELRSRAKRGLR